MTHWSKVISRQEAEMLVGGAEQLNHLLAEASAQLILNELATLDTGAKLCYLRKEAEYSVRGEVVHVQATIELLSREPVSV